MFHILGVRSVNNFDFEIFGVRSVNNFDFDIGLRSVNNFDFDILGVRSVNNFNFDIFGVRSVNNFDLIQFCSIRFDSAHVSSQVSSLSTSPSLQASPGFKHLTFSLLKSFSLSKSYTRATP